MNSQPSGIYITKFSLGSCYNWTGLETLQGLTSLAPGQTSERIAPDIQLAGRARSIELAAMHTLSLLDAKSLTEQRNSLRQAFFLCKNILHLKKIVPPSSREMLQLIFNEARSFQIGSLKNKHDLFQLQDIQKKAEIFLKAAPTLPTRVLEVMPQAEHAHELEANTLVAHTHFKSLAKIIANTEKIATKLTGLFHVAKQSGFFWTLCSHDERLTIAHALQFNLCILQQIDNQVSSIFAAYQDFALDMQIRLSFECRTIFNANVGPVKYLMGDLHSDFKAYCTSPNTKESTHVEMQTYFKALTFPMEIADVSGLCRRVLVKNLAALGNYFNKSSKHIQKFIYSGQKLRRDQKEIRDKLELFSQAIAHLKQPKPSFYSPAFELTDSYAWNGSETLKSIVQQWELPENVEAGFDLEFNIRKAIKSICMAVKYALCSFPCSPSMEGLSEYMQKALHLYCNIKHIIALTPSNQNIDELEIIAEEARTWPMHYFKNCNFNGHFRAVLRALQTIEQWSTPARRAVPAPTLKDTQQQAMKRQQKLLSDLHTLLEEVFGDVTLRRKWHEIAIALDFNALLLTPKEQEILKGANKLSHKLLDEIVNTGYILLAQAKSDRDGHTSQKGMEVHETDVEHTRQTNISIVKCESILAAL